MKNLLMCVVLISKSVGINVVLIFPQASNSGSNYACTTLSWARVLNDIASVHLLELSKRGWLMTHDLTFESYSRGVPNFTILFLEAMYQHVWEIIAIP